MAFTKATKESSNIFINFTNFTNFLNFVHTVQNKTHG